MNPIYKFQLAAGEDSQQAFPIYNNDLSIEYALEQNQQFYRGKLSGKLMFQSEDFTFIRNKPFDTQFGIEIFISYDAGVTWSSYWTGKFWKTDCKFDEDAKTVVVTPTLNDRYNAVLEGLEKEYNLIDLAPAINNIKLDKRPMIQLYIPGQSVVSCFLSGMWWEQECEPEESVFNLTQIGDGKPNFALSITERIVEITQPSGGSPTLPDVLMGKSGDPTTGGGYTFYVQRMSESLGYWVAIKRNSDDVDLWAERIPDPPTLPTTLTLEPLNGATGNIEIYVYRIAVYSRYVCDVQTGMGSNTYQLAADDAFSNNRNYKRVIGYSFPGTIGFSDYLSTTPTKWGIYQPGKYYDVPSYIIPEWFPIGRAAWSRVSVWFAFSSMDWYVEENFRQEYTLKDAYPIWSVISVLLGKIAPGITHAGTIDYSEFLYGENPLLGNEQYLFITPKSNVIYSGYDQPAQDAPITLRQITDMLRDCFRCYWFIDEENRFHIEHISYFMNGGAYPGTPDFPQIGINLTEQIITRNGKPWSYSSNQYQFDKPEMAARYEFGWMDDVTELFDGFPIDIISKYVNPDNIERVEISKFTSDIDYILLNPDEISKDGFVLMAAELVGGEYKLPYVNFEINNSDHVLQNAWAAFIWLQQYYAYDMPAVDYSINGVPKTALGVKKLKTQTLKFPVLVEPDMMNLIKTGIGNGTIQKMSVNLSSRNANTTLKYDTE